MGIDTDKDGKYVDIGIALSILALAFAITAFVYMVFNVDIGGCRG